MPEISNCPYCGGEAKVEHGFYDSDIFWVACTKCNASNYAGDGYNTEEEAIADANKRFVCYDKKGKAVFAGNEVMYLAPDANKLIKCDVLEFRKPRYGWGLAGPNDFMTYSFWPQDIELIEEADND